MLKIFSYIISITLYIDLYFLSFNVHKIEAQGFQKDLIAYNNARQSKQSKVIHDLEIKRADLVALNLNLIDVDTQQIAVTLPDGEKLTLVKIKAYTSNVGAIVWQGKITGVSDVATEIANSAILVKINEVVAGTIRFNNRLFKLMQETGNNYWLKEVDEKKIPNEHSPFEQEPLINESNSTAKALISRGQNTQQTSQNNTAVIRLLVGYTSEAKRQNHDIEALINLSVAETNQGYVNSGVNAQVELAHSYELSYDEVGSTSTDLNRFHNPSDGYMDDVHALRDQYAADVAAIIIGNASGCGRAKEVGSHEDTAFIVVKDSCATGYYSMGHEIGHLLSARHNPEKDPKTDLFAYGHGFLYSAGGWRSIMSYNSNSCCTRQNFWSDPTRQHQNVTRGTVESHDNARVLNITAPIIAAYRADNSANTPPLSNFSTIINNLSVTFINESSDVDNNIIHFDWAFGDGNTSTESSPIYTYTSGGNYDVTLIVTDGMGASNSKTQTISVTPEVENQLPVANFSYNIIQNTVNFIDQSTDSDGDVTLWFWDFGDGETSNLQAPEHVYNQNNNYTVSLTVIDNHGAQATTNQQITINAKTPLKTTDFESGFIHWQNANDNDWNWTRSSGNTPSTGTGPISGAGGQGYYIFLETSEGKGAYLSGETSSIITDELHAKNISLTFDFHMFGDNIGQISVDINDNGTWRNNIWSIQGQQQVSDDSPYQHADIDLSTYSGAIILRIKATAIGGWKGDIALDNITVYGESITLTNRAPTFNTHPIALSSGNSNQTYVASIADLASDLDLNDVLTFSLISGPDWLTVGATGELSGMPTVSHIGQNSFIVRVTDNDGLYDETELTVTIIDASAQEQVLASIDFESGFNQGWSNNSAASDNWTLHQGKTPSSSTGPRSGASRTPTQYAYFETSKGYAYYNGDTAYLDSPVISGTSKTLAFSYHMYGKNIGSLIVDIFHENQWTTDVLTRSGQIQTSSSSGYKRVNVDLSHFTNDIIIRFRAQASGGSKGDVAIDDIEITGFN